MFLVGVRLGIGERAAVLAAAAFCLLPIHSEAVVWVVGRAELMAAAAVGAVLVFLLDYRRHGRTGHLVAAAAALLLGLLSKENAVTVLAAPVLMTLVLPTQTHHRRRDALALAALLGSLCIYLGMRVWAGGLHLGTAGDRLDNPLSSVGLPARMAGATSVLGRYLQLTAWPAPLSVDYSYDALGIGERFRGDCYAMFAIAVCLGLAWVAWRVRSRLPAIAFALLLSAVTYSIVSNSVLLIGTIMGERLFYLPTFGLCLAAGPGLAWLGERAGGKGLALLLVPAACYGVVDSTRARTWRTPVSLFESATRAYPRSARAHMELGGAYGKAGKSEQAIEAFRTATTIMPEYAAAWYNLGNFYARLRAYPQAVDSYRRALAHAPKLLQAWYNLGLVERNQGDLAAAIEALESAARLSPGDAGVHLALGETLLAAGRLEETVRAYDEAVARGGGFAALINRGVAKQRLWGCAAALPDYLAAFDLDPTHRTAYANAAACLYETGRGADAERLAERAGVATRQTGR